jgi:hypothetical protein
MLVLCIWFSFIDFLDLVANLTFPYISFSTFISEFNCKFNWRVVLLNPVIPNLIIQSYHIRVMQRGFEFRLTILPKEIKIIGWCECIFYFKLALKSSHNNQSLLLRNQLHNDVLSLLSSTILIMSPLKINFRSLASYTRMASHILHLS